MHFYNILTVGQFSRKLSHIIYLLILYSGELGELPEKIGPSQYAFVQSLAAVHLKSFETIELLPGQI